MVMVFGKLSHASCRAGGRGRVKTGILGSMNVSEARAIACMTISQGAGDKDALDNVLVQSRTDPYIDIMKHRIEMQKPVTPDLYRRGSCQPLAQNSELVLGGKLVFALARVLRPRRAMAYPLVLYTNTALQNMLLVVRLRLHQFLLNDFHSGDDRMSGDYGRLLDSNTRPLVGHAVVLLELLVVWSIADIWDRVALAYLTPLLHRLHDSKQRSQLLVRCGGYTAETLSHFDVPSASAHDWDQLSRAISQ